MSARQMKAAATAAASTRIDAIQAARSPTWDVCGACATSRSMAVGPAGTVAAGTVTAVSGGALGGVAAGDSAAACGAGSWAGTSSA